MPVRTQKEIKEFAAAFVSRFVANLMLDFPPIGKAIDKLKGDAWAKYLDDAIDDMADGLLTKFGSSD